MSLLYPKINGVFRRHTDGPGRNKLIMGDWVSEELRILAGENWTWTEKLDGTNIRVIWDGYRVSFGGRTDAAQLPKNLAAHLEATFTEELMEQVFREKPVVLFGEGIGAGIQKGGNYGQDQTFVLFDVHIGGIWATHLTTTNVAGDLGIPRAPLINLSLTSRDNSVYSAIHVVEAGLRSTYGDFLAEGLVGRAPCDMLNRYGERITVKVKTCDFYEH